MATMKSSTMKGGKPLAGQAEARRQAEPTKRPYVVIQELLLSAWGNLQWEWLSHQHMGSADSHQLAT
jgi:hypothetical protein